MVEINSIDSEVETFDPSSLGTEDPLAYFFKSEVPRLFAELQQIDQELTFVSNLCSKVQRKYSPESQLPEELYQHLRKNFTRYENAWRQVMKEPFLDHEKAVAAAQERINTLIAMNKVQILCLNENQGLPSLEKYKLITKMHKWTAHLRLIITYVAFSTKSLQPQDWQKIKKVFEKNRIPFSESFMQKALL